MGLFRRTSIDKPEPDLRAVGRLAAFGDVPDGAVAAGRPEDLGFDCGTCGARGRIDMIDTTVRRAYLTCRRCGRTWDTDRSRLPAQPFFART